MSVLSESDKKPSLALSKLPTKKLFGEFRQAVITLVDFRLSLAKANGYETGDNLLDQEEFSLADFLTLFLTLFTRRNDWGQLEVIKEREKLRDCNLILELFLDNVLKEMSDDAKRQSRAHFLTYYDVEVKRMICEHIAETSNNTQLIRRCRNFLIRNREKEIALYYLTSQDLLMD